MRAQYSLALVPSSITGDIDSLRTELEGLRAAHAKQVQEEQDKGQQERARKERARKERARKEQEGREAERSNDRTQRADRSWSETLSDFNHWGSPIAAIATAGAVAVAAPFVAPVVTTIAVYGTAVAAIAGATTIVHSNNARRVAELGYAQAQPRLIGSRHPQYIIEYPDSD